MTPWDADFETDARFPSGVWKGFFLQPARPGRHWMELRFSFYSGKMHGEGRDFGGDFKMEGTYELESGKCCWSKRYKGQHDVSYQGYNEGKGIWGVWEITDKDKDGRGGFHIWPARMPDPASSTLNAEEDVPVPARKIERVASWAHLADDNRRGPGRPKS
jgi:hypothetical protein